MLAHKCAASEARTTHPRSVFTRTTWLPGVCPPTGCNVTPGTTSTEGLFPGPAYTGYSRAIVDRSWDTVGFTATLALKDVDLALTTGAANGVPLPSAEVCRERLSRAIADGDAERDWIVMALAQARASGLA